MLLWETNNPKQLHPDSRVSFEFVQGPSNTHGKAAYSRRAQSNAATIAHHLPLDVCVSERQDRGKATSRLHARSWSLVQGLFVRLRILPRSAEQRVFQNFT